MRWNKQKALAVLASAFVVNVVKGILLFLIIFVAKRIFDSKNPYLNPNTKYTAAIKHTPATM